MTFATKTWLSSKTRILQERFLKFDLLILTPNVLVGSENWLVSLSYDQESISKVVNFFGIFLCSEMKRIQCLTMPLLRVWILPQKLGYRPKTNYLLFHLNTSRFILQQLLTIYFAWENVGKVQNVFAIINERMEGCTWGLCSFYDHFGKRGHLLQACKLSIRPDFLGHIYANSNFTPLFSALACSQNSVWDFFHYWVWRRRFFLQKKKKKKTLFFGR